MVLPHLPAAAALSAAHLSAILFPATLRRLYIARDDDPAGDGAMTTLIERARAVGIEAISLSPRLGDFNEDLRIFGADALRSEEHTSELQSLMRISYAVFCLKKKTQR